MYFDDRPKSDLNSLYDRRRELDEILAGVRRGDPLIVISGLRREGKTSLLNIAPREAGVHAVFVDARHASYNATAKETTQIFEVAFNDFLLRNRKLAESLRDLLKSIKGVEIAGLGISLAWSGDQKANLPAVMDALNAWAEQRARRIVVAIDEVQMLRGRFGRQVANMLAHMYDYCRSITTVITGSQFGLLNDFLGVDEPEAPLYGRGRLEVKLEKFSHEQSLEFLKLGFKQVHIRVDEEELRDVIHRLDGIVGWLTKFGAACVRSGKFDLRILSNVIEEGEKLAVNEFEHFMQGRPRETRDRYLIVLKTIARGKGSWTEVKRGLQEKEGKIISDSILDNLLSNLLTASIINKANHQYGILDPLLANALIH